MLNSKIETCPSCHKIKGVGKACKNCGYDGGTIVVSKPVVESPIKNTILHIDADEIDFTTDTFCLEIVEPKMFCEEFDYIEINGIKYKRVD